MQVTITEKGADKKIRGARHKAGETVAVSRRDARTLCAVKFAENPRAIASDKPASKSKKKSAGAAPGKKKYKNRALESE